MRAGCAASCQGAFQASINREELSHLKLKGIKSFIWEKKSVHTVERSPLKGPRRGRATFELPNATGGSGKGDQKPQKLTVRSTKAHQLR